MSCETVGCPDNYPADSRQVSPIYVDHDRRAGLFCGFLCKFCRHEVFIRHAAFQFAGLFQNVLQQGKGILLEDQVVGPGILLRVAGYDRGDRLQVGLFELGLDDLGDFFRRMAVDIVHAFLQGIGERLDCVRVFFDKAALGAECSVRHIARIRSEGGYHIAVAFGLQRGGVRLEFYSVSFLLLQNCEKIKSANAVCFFVNLYIPDRTFPKCLFMSFIKLQI